MILFLQLTIKQLLHNHDSTIDVEKNQKLTNTFLITDNFDPMQQFETIGLQEINHFELLEGALDWDRLLARIPRSKWRVFVFNRFEFQEHSNGILTDDEKKLVLAITNSLEQE